MYKIFRFRFLHILFIVYLVEIYFCLVHAGDLEKLERKTVNQKSLIDELHSLYKDAFENEKTYVTRRFFGKDGHMVFTLHVQKLKEVNGYKTHNLRAEGRSKNEESIIYINNPIESGMPNPFLSIDEFRKNMIERVLKQDNGFDVKKNQAYNKVKHFLSEKLNAKNHVKQEVVSKAKTEVPTKSSNNKLMKETLHKGNHKVDKKRKPKVYLSRVAKSTTKPRIKTTTTLSKTKVSDEFLIFDNNNENKTVTKTVANENIKNTITTTIADAKITTDFVTAKGITTKPPTDVETTTATVAIEDITTKPTFGEEITTLTVDVENKTTESTAGDELTTAMVAIENITTETTVDDKITTEMVTNEVSTDTTTETTVKTRRTRQAKPYVFLGNK